MAQITNITSEALQETVRRLLPSQQGFGEDLQATNLITPIIDLTPSAEGSEFRADLQTAIAFGSQTTFEVSNTSSNLVTGGGFYRVFGSVVIVGGDEGTFDISDGLATKQIFKVNGGLSGDEQNAVYDFTIFLRPTDTLVAASSGLNANVVGSFRQVADSNGVLVNPVGFQPQ